MKPNNAPNITLQDLELMSTHQLADLLANIAILLRQSPDIVFRDLHTLVPQLKPEQASDLIAQVRKEGKKQPEVEGQDLPDWLS